MRLPPQDGHTERALHENPTAIRRGQSGHAIKAKPRARIPQSTKPASSARTNAGSGMVKPCSIASSSVRRLSRTTWCSAPSSGRRRSYAAAASITRRACAIRVPRTHCSDSGWFTRGEGGDRRFRRRRSPPGAPAQHATSHPAAGVPCPEAGVRAPPTAGLPPRRARRPRASSRAGPRAAHIVAAPDRVRAEHERARRRARRLGEAGRAQARRAEHGTVGAAQQLVEQATRAIASSCAEAMASSRISRSGRARCGRT